MRWLRALSVSDTLMHLILRQSSEVDCAVTLRCRWGSWGMERLHCVVKVTKGAELMRGNRTASSSGRVKLSKLLSLPHQAFPLVIRTSDSLKLAFLSATIMKLSTYLIYSPPVRWSRLPCCSVDFPGQLQGLCVWCIKGLIIFLTQRVMFLHLYLNKI